MKLWLELIMLCHNIVRIAIVNNNWQDFINYFINQRIVLFGNAKSVLSTEKEIDTQYDIICRTNKGFSQGQEKYIGTRTDVLFLSIPLTDKELLKFNPNYLVWCTPKHNKMTSYLKENALFYNEKDWKLLNDKLGHRPSTGMMAIDLLSCLSSSWKSLTLYGFDHWKTETWYLNRIVPCHHNPEAEKKYIEELIKAFNGRIIKL
jgi:hypothetical protein